MSGWKNAPSHVRAALEHLRTKFTDGQAEGVVDVSWARRIVERHQAGETVAAATLDMARAALAARDAKGARDAR